MEQQQCQVFSVLSVAETFYFWSFYSIQSYFRKEYADATPKRIRYCVTTAFHITTRFISTSTIIVRDSQFQTNVDRGIEFHTNLLLSFAVEFLWIVHYKI